MDYKKILQKPFLTFVFVFNMLLFGIIVFLMSYVQNLLDNDSRNNLTEIVSQNRDVITSRLMLDLNRLDIIGNKISESLKSSELDTEQEIDDFLAEYSKHAYDESMFLANRNGVAFTEGGRQIDVSGRRYFKLASNGTSNISDKTISRINGEYVFIGSVPLYYDEKIVGTIQKIYTYEQMYELFTVSLFSSKGYMYVINSEGYVILHTEHPDCHLKSDNYFRDVYEGGNVNAARKIKTDINNNQSGFMEVVLDGEKAFSAYTPINQIHDWYLVTSVPTNVIAENGNVVMKIFYSVLLVMALIFLISTCYFFWNKQQQRRQLEKIAFVDEVTGGNTYNKFVVKVNDTLAKASDESFYILNFDVDNFKYINNFYGFSCGDKLLQQIYQITNSLLAPDECVARISGDQFICLLKNADETRLENLFAALQKGNEEAFLLHFSAGVYVVCDRQENINLMIDKASVAAQTIKGVLNKTVAYYDKSFDDLTAHNEQLKRALKQAIRNDEFVAFYQPKIDINDGRLVGAEALIRWKTTENKLVSPGEFIPLAEKTGLVTELDMIVFEKVLQFLRQALDAGIECVPISVNFSRLHFYNSDFFDKILRKIEAYQVPADLLELELTESAVFDNFTVVYDFTRKVREYGIAIAMDDFGSGYSSLNMLKDLPIDTLKIDRAFLENSADNEKRNIIFVSIVRMARRLGISLVVEGVETSENITLMRKCGCSVAQGYYFSKPVEEETFAKIFREGHIC
ncbi:EAL domain-containing protein [Phascolarctobacterium sp.]|uniref:bifunctional diguanylate cyclase/phosphodiesterase n=1 Tax=Phascolarctobacterium sp. TaxID=2049039 RepID=UPI00302A0962